MNAMSVLTWYLFVVDDVFFPMSRIESNLAQFDSTHFPPFNSTQSIISHHIISHPIPSTHIDSTQLTQRFASTHRPQQNNEWEREKRRRKIERGERRRLSEISVLKTESTESLAIIQSRTTWESVWGYSVNDGRDQLMVDSTRSIIIFNVVGVGFFDWSDKSSQIQSQYASWLRSYRTTINRHRQQRVWFYIQHLFYDWMGIDCLLLLGCWLFNDFSQFSSTEWVNQSLTAPKKSNWSIHGLRRLPTLLTLTSSPLPSSLLHPPLPLSRKMVALSTAVWFQPPLVASWVRPVVPSWIYLESNQHRSEHLQEPYH